MKQPQTGVLDGLANASKARGASISTNPLTTWLSGGLLLMSKGQPVNPLVWWMQKQFANNTHGGLLQMALDVLSCPGAFLYLFFLLISLLTCFNQQQQPLWMLSNCLVFRGITCLSGGISSAHCLSQEG